MSKIKKEMEGYRYNNNDDYLDDEYYERRYRKDRENMELLWIKQGGIKEPVNRGIEGNTRGDDPSQ